MKSNKKDWFWMSFADHRGFLGVAIVQGKDFGDALKRSILLGINPGGELKCYSFSAQEIANVPMNLRHKLLNKQEAELASELPTKTKH